MQKFLLFTLLITGISHLSFSQMAVTFTQTTNTICDGADCDYNGPSILINEIMASPATHDGCLSGTSSSECKGEWIELYNPDLCQPVDISCYYLGATTPGTLGQDREAYLLPQGTIVPAGGFCVVRGENAPAVPSNELVQNGGNVVEIIMNGTINTDGMCVQGGGGIFPTPPTRFWFPNAAGGWFAFYDRNGVPQDAVYWGAVGSVVTGEPCIPTRTGCNNSVTTLSSFADIPANRKTQIHSSSLPNSWGQSLRRIPDGGSWVASQGEPNPTMGRCNTTCASVGSSSCDGTATIHVTGGTAPYTYKWSDSQGQLTQEATGLCGGSYTVIVKDNAGLEQTFSVTIQDHVPTVTFDPLADICNEGQTVPLVGAPVATAGQTGVFSGTGVSGSNFSASTSGDGSFPLTYTFTDENGCTNNATSSINVYPQPVASISGINADYCFSNDIITPTVSPAGGVLSGPGVSNGQFSIADAGTGTHTLKYVVVAQPGGCSDSVEVTVTITPNPAANFTIQPDICAMAAPISLSADPPGGIFTVNGQQITEFDPTNYPLGEYVIMYSVADPNNPACNSTATDTINVVDGLPISSNIPDYFCFGDPNFDVVITPVGGQLTGDSSGILNGDQLVISAASQGTYTVYYEYTTQEGCHSSYEKTFTVGHDLQVSYDFLQDCFQNITLTADPILGNFVQYTWIHEGTTVLGTGSVFSGYIEEHGEHTFTVEAVDNRGCMATHTAKDSVAEGVKAGMFQIPNVVTANGDGINDAIFMPMMDNDCINYEVLILNRWGNLVYKANKANPSFGGKDMNGKALSDGVYFYKVISESFDCNSDEYKPVCYGFITVVSK